METRRRRTPLWLAALALAGVAAVRSPAVVVATEGASPGRDVVERRVEELERQFRAARDQALARCRGAWSVCTNTRCKQVPSPQTSKWQACQDECDASLEHCNAAAYEIWPEDD